LNGHEAFLLRIFVGLDLIFFTLTGIWSANRPPRILSFKSSDKPYETRMPEIRFFLSAGEKGMDYLLDGIAGGG